MFAGELASIEDLERSKEEVFKGIGPLNAINTFELMVNFFDGLFDLFSLSIFASFVDIL